MTRRLVLTALVGASLILAALGWRTAGTATPTGTTDTAPAAPVLNAGRAPAILAGSASDARIRAVVANAVSAARLGTASATSCVVIAQGAREIVELGPQLPLTPASTLKIITASAVLDAYGPDARFTTAVKRNNKVDDGSLRGPLYLVGGGDPLLFTTDYAAAMKFQPEAHTPLERLADQVAAEGITTVQGDLIADGSRFAEPYFVPSWDPNFVATGEVGPSSAVLVNQGFERFNAGRVVAPNADLHSGTLFRDLLAARGIRVTGRVITGKAPEKADEVTSIESAPLRALVGEMLTYSDNTTAEVLLKNLGLKVKGSGTTSAGLDAGREHLLRLDPSATVFAAADGSGLDRGNKATCGAIDAVLQRDGPEGPIAQGLAVAGITGTLSDRMENSVATGNVRAKTGTLANVSALAGWVSPGSRPPLSFSVINNGISTESGRRFEDQLATALASLPTPTPVDAYATVPTGP